MDERRLPGLGPRPELLPGDEPRPDPEPAAGQHASSSAGPRIAAAGCLFPLAIGAAIFALLQAVPHCGGGTELAMQRLEACPAAVEALGPNVRSAVGVGCGQTEISGAYGHASWSLPVRGDTARGRYAYSAEKHGGEWTLTGAWLEVDGTDIDIATCATATAAPAATPGKPPAARTPSPAPKPPRRE